MAIGTLNGIMDGGVNKQQRAVVEKRAWSRHCDGHVCLVCTEREETTNEAEG